MKLSQMVTNAIKKHKKQEIKSNKNKDILDDILDAIKSEEKTYKKRPEGHLQSRLTDGERSTAADIEEDELEIIKAIANPALTPAENNLSKNIDPKVQAEIEELKKFAL